LATAWACSGAPFTSGAMSITGMALTGISSNKSLIRKQYLCPKLCKARGSRCRFLFYRNARHGVALFSARRASLKVL
jgi:hypothetical protein